MITSSQNEGVHGLYSDRSDLVVTPPIGTKNKDKVVKETEIVVTAIKTESSEKDGVGEFIEFSNFKLKKNAYGGNQSWYVSGHEKETRYEEDAKYRNKYTNMENTGCGPVAATNILMYYVQQNFGNVGRKLYKKSIITQADFLEFMEIMYDAIPQTRGVEFIGFKKTAGVWFIGNFINSVNKYALSKNVKLKSKSYNNFSNDINGARNFIREGLSKIVL
jgi:hypothetical protein